MLKWVAQNFFAQILSLAVSFFDRVFVVGFLIRGFGVERYADWIALASFAGLLNLAEVGINLYFGNLMQHAFARRDEAAFNRIVHVSAFVSSALCLVLFLAGALALGLVRPSSLMPAHSLSSEETYWCAIALAGAVISKIMRGPISQIYRGRQEFARGILIDLVCAAAVPIVSVPILFFGGSPQELAIGYLLCDLVAGWGVMIADIRRRYPFLSLRPALPVAHEVSSLLAYVKWQAMQGANGYLSLSAPPLILVAAGVGAKDVVAFTTARTLVNLGRQIVTMLLQAAGVEIASRLHVSENASIAEYSVELGAVGAAVVGGMGIGLSCYGGSLVALWTGHAELFDATLYFWLCVGALCNAVAAPFQILMGYVNKPRTAALAGSMNVALGLPLAALAASAGGANGLTFGLAVGEIAACLLAIGKLFPATTGGDPLRYFRRCFVATAFASLWCAAAAAALREIAPQGGVIGLAIQLVGFAALGALPALLFVAPSQMRARALIDVRVWLRKPWISLTQERRKGARQV
jgi:O-antigen/teichoic acid export membrane protein